MPSSNPPLTLDTNVLQHPSHPSAIIQVPASWDSSESPSRPSIDSPRVSGSLGVSPKTVSTSSLRAAIDIPLPHPEPPLSVRVHRESHSPSQLSATSSSSESKSFGWPPPTSSTSRRDPFPTATTFAEDPFGHSSSSSSSDDHGPQIATTRPPPTSPLSTSKVPDKPHPLVCAHPSAAQSLATPPALNRSFSSSKGVSGLLQPKGGAKEDPYSSISVELVDSLRTAIQTLLYVSPPHLLDNAKEQYSGCAIQVPATSVSALLTSFRGLNYLCANLVPICNGGTGPVRHMEDFDIGELLQNVADQLSSEAAQAEVDLVLFHGDVGMKHVNMYGDRNGIALVYGHVLRQILSVCDKGDTLELGLQILPQSGQVSRSSLANVHQDVDRDRRRNSSWSSLDDHNGPFMCVFEIVHNVAQHTDSNAATPKAELNPFTHLAEQKEAATPHLDTTFTHSLLRQVNAWVRTDAVPSSPSSFGVPRHAYELYVVLSRGAPITEPLPLTAEEEADRQPFSGLTLPREPTLAELEEFAESLRGKKVNLHASLASVFARHLTSYLTAWGLDVSHIPIEDETTHVQSTSAESSQNSKFVIIDEDVFVLKRELGELGKLRTENAPSLLRTKSTRRPGLGRNSRSAMTVRPPPNVIIIHFTSLDKYHQVRDVVASLGNISNLEVMVVPKPVGPRRFLTALYTAVRQQPVDPSFQPIATSPRSPHIASGNRTPTGVIQEGFFDSFDSNTLHPEAGIVKAVRSPLGEHPPALMRALSTDPLRLSAANNDELVTTPASEYFSRPSLKRSGASGVVLQSPDGRPVGMYFEPPSSSNLAILRHRPDNAPRRQTSSRQTTAETDPVDLAGMSAPSESPNSSRRLSAVSGVSDVVEQPEHVSTPLSSPAPPAPQRRKTLPTPPDAKPMIAQGRNRSSTVTLRHALSEPAHGRPLPGIAESSKPGSKTVKTSDVVVPPINVLIVEDNPINRNILSMFFRRKKIKHKTATNGKEAVEMWRSGGFHLILMDIQLPVMDGIEATKTIRRLEQSNNIGVFPSTPIDHPRNSEESGETAAPPQSPFRSSVIIVALTASSLQTDRVAALAAGCNDFLTKPVSLKWLEKKTIEWGCMQALIDFDGWRRWKSSEPSETKLAFQTAPQAAARSVANRLRLDPSRTRAGAKAIKDAEIPVKPKTSEAKPEVLDCQPSEIQVTAPTPHAQSPEVVPDAKPPEDQPNMTNAKAPNVNKEEKESIDALGLEKPLPALPVE
ncbi:uncharacterized protein CcaverHIS019_0705360 [Cutaneotrichosporon cavernicola]|uniref:Response regulatory domain-containing protein n=1 Tax=Cutaneotrichosporon cavernicola TaxID=279322 RepID=A0AA48LAJ9_9TREE|nr:uncharacterized protein CcaverHIS019_0705360 [Cutaneotrichosporon cavernicola]BEI94955.1 hypothetical protein CcaverHIS019_0705360 [Cutaneotrichosporon cavernicola]BEJ02729.1 hypothetical protein CcaverHIS631_0705240 [Cutaneotrichosporon cavernicola]BEJ10482.1 hypothetical protein CcaverHIS641_0705170 [Cutaneotrichosporon cavernicola]